MERERKKPRENILAGAIGAFVGAWIGVACMVLGSWLGNEMIGSGVMMPLCTIMGYVLLGGRLGWAGAGITGLTMLVMTSIGNDLCFAVEIVEAVEGVSFFDAFRAIDMYRETKVIDGYWGVLGFRYLFVLVGSVPVIIGMLRRPAAGARRPYRVPDQSSQPELQGTFYTLQKSWMTPLRLSVCGPVLVVFGGTMILWLVASATLKGVDTFVLASGGFLSMVVLFCMALPALVLCNSTQILYVRTGSELWRVDLNVLFSIQDWEKAPPSRQEAVKKDILRRIQLQKKDEGPHWDFSGLVLLKELRVEKETPWSWKVSYETGWGSRKKLTIGKGYPNFVPDRSLERPQGPVPARWSFPLISLVLTAVLMAPGCVLALRPDAVGLEPGPGPEPTPEAELTAAPEKIPARMPERFTEYEMSEVWFKVDAEFQVGRRTFLDGGTGTFYRVYVQYGVDAGDAWDTLANRLSEYRSSPLYDRFDAVYLAEDPLLPLGKSSRYNILSVYLTDGRVLHTAVVLSDDGTLFTMEASHDSAQEIVDDVLANLMYTVESVRFSGPVVTEENYQSQIHVSKVRDCEFMAAAYLRTDIFGHDAFVDVYVPYSEQLIYTGGGQAVRSEAHGLRVYVTILPGETAKAVIDAQQQALAASGRVYEEGVDDELYWEDSDVACRLTVYEENGQKRYAVLYADPKWEGYYLFREFTGLPELVDGDYATALAELERLSGLTMPTLEALGQSDS